MDAGDLDIAGALAARAAAAGSTDSLARSMRGASAQEAAAKFEALFASMLVKEMRKALPEGFFGEGAGGDIYGGWLDEHLGAAIARTGALHLKPLVELGMTHDAAARAYSGVQPMSVGVPPVDADMHTIDAGLSPTDAGLRPMAEGSHPNDAGLRATDADFRPTDEGVRAMDEVSHPNKAGMHATDASLRPTDASLRPTDASLRSTEEPR